MIWSFSIYKSYLSYGVVLEGLAMAKPVMHFRDDEPYLKYYDELYPMLHARSANEVTRRMIEAADDRVRLAAIGRTGLSWFQRHAVDRPLRVIRELIERKALKSVS